MSCRETRDPGQPYEHDQAQCKFLCDRSLANRGDACWAHVLKCDTSSNLHPLIGK
jgi:hypothetical protein